MPLISYKFKKLGWGLLFVASILAILYFSIDFRFKVPVFAVLSVFAETKYFTVFKTNFADESILLLFIVGFFFLVFTKEKDELPFYRDCRIKAVQKTCIIFFGWMLFSVLFFYGAVFIGVLIINIIFPFVVYLIFFEIYKKKLSESNQEKIG